MTLGFIAAGVGIVSGVNGMIQSKKAGDRASQANDAQAVQAERQAAMAERQDGRSQEQWDRYKNTYAPIEDQMANEAKDMGSVANQNKAASDAAATSAASFSTARERLNRNPGLNPSSQQYQQLQSGMDLAEAANSAASQTGAREMVKDRASAALTNAVSIGKGLPASATLGANSAATMGSMAGTMQGQVASNANAAGQSEINGVNGFAKSVSGFANSDVGKSVGGWISDKWNGSSTPSGSGIAESNATNNSDFKPSNNYGTE